MMDFNGKYSTEGEIDGVFIAINEKFDLNIGKQLKDLGQRFKTFHEIIDLVNNTKYYSIGLADIDLNFQDRQGLFELLIKFLDKEIANIPNELEELESERHSRDFDDHRHFYNTEALSEKEGNLNKLKSQLIKESKRKSKK